MAAQRPEALPAGNFPAARPRRTLSGNQGSSADKGACPLPRRMRGMRDVRRPDVSRAPTKEAGRAFADTVVLVERTEGRIFPFALYNG